MRAGAASVVIVSHQRPAHLRACVTQVLAQDPAQVIVVADDLGLDAVQDLASGDRLAPVRYDQRNISVARNLGVARVTTPVVAFIDDDSRPEPGWLHALAGGFADPQVIAATGPVRTGDTVRWQFRGERIDNRARITALSLSQTQPSVLAPPPDGAIVTIGTNCAFRAGALRDIGGFDPAYRYFLDESDLNMRLAALGGRTCYHPMAQVRHYRASGPYRRSDGQLRDLTEIGASLARFLRQHGDKTTYAQDLKAALAKEGRRLMRAMQRGDLEPRDVVQGQRQLRQGAQRTDPHTEPPENRTA